MPTLTIRNLNLDVMQALKLRAKSNNRSLEAEARNLLEDYRRHAGVEGALAHASASLGIDFARYGMDEPIEAGPTQAIQSNVEAAKRAAGPVWTKRKLIDQFVLGSRQPPIVGSAAQVAEALIDWTKATGVDGFNLSRTVAPECWTDFGRLVVPELQMRRAFKTAHRPGTLRDKLFRQGDQLPASHPALRVPAV